MTHRVRMRNRVGGAPCPPHGRRSASGKTAHRVRCRFPRPRSRHGHSGEVLDPLLSMINVMIACYRRLAQHGPRSDGPPCFETMKPNSRLKVAILLELRRGDFVRADRFRPPSVRALAKRFTWNFSADWVEFHGSEPSRAPLTNRPRGTTRDRCPLGRLRTAWLFEDGDPPGRALTRRRKAGKIVAHPI